jgi:CubicO group peptidase (beta-lactamase class C family)
MPYMQSRSGYTLDVRRVAFVLAVSLAALSSVHEQTTAASADDPVPQTLDEFQREAANVLRDTGVPGAGLALVRQSGIEWAGGVGYAERDRQIPVTADTVFRVGSISKTLIALALVQLSEDGLLDLDSPVAEAAPEVDVINPWEDSDPVRVIHLLQHTAGFDDMHFNEMYVPAGEPDRPLHEVLRINPRSRRVRWKPGTRMSYSNPGYAVAGLILEQTAAMPYEDFIAREIFQPLSMSRSSFRLTSETQSQLAQGYTSQEGPPVPLRGIYLRPAGNMVSSASDMGRFVQMLLGWGELGDAFVVDPEYLGNMEQPRTTLATAAGLRNGYGTGIFTTLDLPYRVLGHNGGIDGFMSSYAYSPSRDVGYVVLLNSAGVKASEALRRLSAMAIGYLKRDIQPPAKPEADVDPQLLDRYVGYYHDANPRNQFAWPLQFLFSGREIVREGNVLYAQPVLGDRQRLVAVSDSTFRLENEIDASRVFTTDDAGVMVLAGPQVYAERTDRWTIDLLRGALGAAVLIIGSVLVVAVFWVARLRRAAPRGFWTLKLAMLLCPVVLVVPFAVLSLSTPMSWGKPTAATIAVFVATLAIPLLSLAVSLLTVNAIRERGSRMLVTYAGLVALAMGGVSLYLRYHDMLGLRVWAY